MENELKRLRIKRGSIKSRLTIFINFLHKYKADTNESKNCNELKIRLSHVESLLDDFYDIQSQIEFIVEKPEEEFDEREKFENLFFANTTEASDLISKNIVHNPNIADNISVRSQSPIQNISPAHSNESIHIIQNDQHIETSSQVQNQNHIINDTSGVKLPTINLPSFSGETESWLEFHDAFDSLINNNSTIGDFQRFVYLRAALKGEALETIASIKVTNQNYRVAWNILCDSYTDKRTLLHDHSKALCNIQSLSKESSAGLKQMIDHVNKHLRSLTNLGEPTQHWDTLLIYLITSKLDPITSRDWESQKFSNQVPKLSDLMSFLKDKCNMLKKVEIKHSEQFSVSVSKQFRVKEHRPEKHTQKSFVSNTLNCPLCNASHKLFSCHSFLKLPIQSRLEQVRKLKLCINCLNPGHQRESCKYGSCKICKGKHNSLLHFDTQDKTNDSATSSGTVASTSSNSLSSIIASPNQVLLSTVIIGVFDSQGNLHNCRALLDSGSQSNFISQSFSDKLGIQKSSVNMTVVGITKVQSVIKSKCQIQIQSKHNSFTSTLSCLIIDNICDNLPSKRIDISSLPIPYNVRLADPEFFSPQSIDLIIGSDLFWQVLCVGQIRLGASLPILHKTKFGWIVSGPIGTSSSETVHCNFSSNIDIQQQLARFWEIEDFPQHKAYSVEEQACESHFVSTHSRDPEGRFIVQIPLKESPAKLGDSSEQAVKRFHNLERKLQRNLKLRESYTSFIHEYKSLGHMEKVHDESSEQSCYFFPHHGVLKEDSLTTKLRVVFDGSCPTTTGWSLNDIQMVGPNIQSDLFSILIRFREHSYVVSSDICKMYRQVLIDPSQTHLQQIFWRDSPDELLSIYSLKTVTYGTASASFLAIRSLCQLAIENKSSFPSASSIIQEDFYVDDLLTGSDSLEEISILCKQITEILKQGCFELRKWISNDSRALLHVQNSPSELNVLQLGSHDSAKTLGLLWCPHEDIIMYHSGNFIHVQRITKRSILSCISQIYDPLGLLSCCTVVAKIILQKLWLEKLAWDESVPLEIHTRWIKFQDELNILNNIKIPRHIKCPHPIFLELHTFSDASEVAYGACAYVRSVGENSVTVHLLCAKSKVAPLKSITLPRLELCGALVAAKLANKILKSSRIQFHGVYHWTDSTIVLGWINTPSHCLKTFVSNRIAEIQSSTKQDNWYHVSGKSNPADLLSRGVNPSTLISLDIWWHGPSWLQNRSSEWNNSNVPKCIHIPELKIQSQLSAISTEKSDFISVERFSTLSKLKRCTAYVLRFINNCKVTLTRKTGPLTHEELNNALICLSKFIQFKHFHQELKDLKAGKPVKALQSLSPFIDETGLIRVGGRLKFSEFDLDKRHPILLPAKDYFVILIFRDMHLKLFHSGPYHMLSSIRETFWPISGRNTARKVVRECFKCFHVKPTFHYPRMGELPKDRVTPAPPFYITGVDYAGPFILKDRKGRGCKTFKAWISLFICLTTKAIHLEIATDLSKEAFLAAFKRFISRRGKPARMLSDNGTNFIGSKNELDSIVNFLRSNSDEFAISCANEGIEWKFIPANSPHFGGLWEAGVRSVKFHLKRILGNVLLTYEEFLTVLVQVEAILNSRPLYASSSDPNDLSPITPAHFLIGRKLTSIPDPNYQDVNDSRLGNFQKLQKLQQHFWSRWSREYLGELQQRKKWPNSCPNLTEGTLVLIKDANLPPLSWRLGRIAEVHPGKDGTVRVVTINTSRGIIKRASANVCPLPVIGQ